MIPYLFHVSILVAACYLFYLVFLQKETYFQLNRFVLMGCVLVAFSLPFLEIPQEWSLRNAKPIVAESLILNKKDNSLVAPSTTNKIVFPKKESTVKLEETVKTTNTSVQPTERVIAKLTIWQVLRYTYIIGVAIFAFNFLLQLIMLLIKMWTKPSIKDGNIRIVEVGKDKAPFSFLNSIFLNPEKYEWDTYEQILEHEKIHIQEGHTLDILLAELLVIVQWFNPFAWWYRRAVENNLEYLTDQKMLAKGTNPESYQMNLLKVSVPHLPLNLTTNYNTSFLKKRISMMNQQKSSMSSSWKYFFLFPLLGLSIITFNSVKVSAQNEPKEAAAEANEIVEAAIEEAAEAAEAIEIMEVVEIAESQKLWPQYSQDIDLLDTEGEWEAKIEGNQICYHFIKRKHHESVYWERRVCIDKPDFSKIDEHSFTMTRAAGTVAFKGKVTAKGGSGTYIFTPNLDFQQYLQSEGFEMDEQALFHCCLTDVNKEYIAYLKEQDYNLSTGELTQFAVHGITQASIEQYIPGMKKLGFGRLTASNLIALSIHEVELAYVAELKDMLQEDLTISNLVAAKIHDIDPDYIRTFSAAGFEDMDFDDLIAFAIHDIDPDYIQSLKDAGLKDLEIEEITAAGIHGIDAAYIQKFQQAGFDNMDFDDLIAFAIHDIDPAYIESLRQAGLKDLDMDEITAAGIHGIDAAYIQKFQQAGFENMDFDDLIAFAIHDIDPAYIESLRQAGLKDLDMDEITAAGIHGIDAAYIQKFQQAGFEDMDFDNLIGFAIHDIDPDYIQSLQNAGLEDLNIDEITAAGIHGVEVEFIQEMKEAGFSDLSMDELVGAKIHQVDKKFIEKARKNGYDFKKLEDYVELKLEKNRLDEMHKREE